jgi:hypothetical protein
MQLSATSIRQQQPSSAIELSILCSSLVLVLLSASPNPNLFSPYRTPTEKARDREHEQKRGRAVPVRVQPEAATKQAHGNESGNSGLYLDDPRAHIWTKMFSTVHSGQQPSATGQQFYP